MNNPITNDPKLQQRLLSKSDVSPGGCLIWNGGKNGRGYGLISVSGKSRACHRVAWEIENGPIPDGVHVLHECDNGLCINTSHMFLGTHLDNMRDKKNKGRCHRPTGSRNGRSVLAESDIPRIRKLYANGVSQTEIAEEYGVCSTTISNIIIGKSWSHVTWP